MPPSSSLLTNLKHIYQANPAIALALIWVLLVPALGSTLLISYLYAGPTDWTTSPSLGDSMVMVFLGALLMGLAFVPTTLLAISTGFLWSWEALPLLVLSYTIASLIGYFTGKTLDKNSLGLLLHNYPKAAKLVEQKQSKMGSLVFFVRISPVIPFALSNLLFALLEAGWKKVVLFGAMGMLPRTIMAFSTGVMASSIAEAFEKKEGGTQVLLFIGLLALSIFGIWRFFKKSAQ
ncbi:hypothetical protein GCM10028791_09350 [Echinicola sediminis]